MAKCHVALFQIVHGLDGASIGAREVDPPVLQQGEEGPPRDGVHGGQEFGGAVQPGQAWERAARALPGEIAITDKNASRTAKRNLRMMTRS